MKIFNIIKAFVVGLTMFSITLHVEFQFEIIRLATFFGCGMTIGIIQELLDNK